MTQKSPQQKSSRKTPAASTLGSLTRRARRLGAAVFFFSVLVNLLLLVSPIYMLQIYDRVLASGSGETLLYLTLVALGLLAALGGFEHYRTQILVRFGTELSDRLDGALFRGVLGAMNKTVAGQPTQPLRDLETIKGFLGSSAPTTLMDAPWAPFFLIIVFLMHPWLGVVATGGALCLAGLAVLTEAVSRTPLKSAHDLRLQSMGQIDRIMRDAPVIEAMGMSKSLLGRWLAPYRDATAHQNTASERSGGVRAFIKFLRPAVQAGMLGTGAWLALRGEITAGVIVAASIISGRALAPMEQAVGNWRQMVGALEAYRRLNQFVTLYCGERTDRVILPKPSGAVMVEGIAGGPPGTRSAVLNNLSFSLPAGEFIGIAGPSGAGKSTLANMLVGIWKPFHGHVRLDGADIFHWHKEDLGPYIGFLPQYTEIFDGTVAQNIARFAEVDSDAVLESARLAGVHDMILRFEKGYETPVGESGIWLSAGQRQRLNLARAIYGRPPLLVLDEPNSHLDAAGEAALIETLKTVKTWGTTVVLICHRPPLLALSDRVMILKDGQIQVLGPTAEVMKGLVRPAPTPAPAAPKTPPADADARPQAQRNPAPEVIG